MKLFLTCLFLFSVFGPSFAADRPYRVQPRKRIYKDWTFGHHHNAVPGRIPSIEEGAESQLEPISSIALPLATIGIPLGKRALSYLAQCALCDTGCPSIGEIQSDASQGEKAAKLMAVMDALEGINAVEKKLSELKRSMMKDDQMAEAEVFDWISSAIDGVKSVAKGVKGFARDVVCDNKK